MWAQGQHRIEHARLCKGESLRAHLSALHLGAGRSSYLLLIVVTKFPAGPTTVTVTAKDAAGNTGTGTFTVTVRPAFTNPVSGVTQSTAGAPLDLRGSVTPKGGTFPGTGVTAYGSGDRSAEKRNPAIAAALTPGKEAAQAFGCPCPPSRGITAYFPGESFPPVSHSRLKRATVSASPAKPGFAPRP